jgi:hypothetical protein
LETPPVFLNPSTSTIASAQSLMSDQQSTWWWKTQAQKEA